MRIKPIHWRNVYEKGILQQVKADLPLRHDIVIRRDNNVWSWTIYNGVSTARIGYAKNRASAKQQCWEAWQWMVKNALTRSSFYILLTDDGIETVCSTRAEVEEKIKEVTGSENGKGDFYNVLKYTIDLDGTITLAEEWGK